MRTLLNPDTLPPCLFHSPASSTFQGSCTPLMVATLHPQVATITPQYAVPFTLSCAAGRPALVEQTAAVLVIPLSWLLLTEFLWFLSFFIFSSSFLFHFLLVFSFFLKKFNLVSAEGMEACAVLQLCSCCIFNVLLFSSLTFAGAPLTQCGSQEPGPRLFFASLVW